MNKFKILPVLLGDQANLYTAAVPAAGQHQNMHANSLGSKYAQAYGHNTSSQFRRVVRQLIYDAAPQQYMDLKILSMKTPNQEVSDEFFYHEAGFGRDPILSQVIPADIVTAAVQLVPIQNLNSVSLDMIVVYPDNSRGTITAINEAAKTITITAESNNLLPAIPAGIAGSFQLANHSPVEADGMNSISQYFRLDTVERCNYVQMLIKAMRFGKLEMYKYQRAGQLSNYVNMQKKRLYQQFRVSLANIYWNGNRGEVTLANGTKAKTAGGVFPIMQQAGSANASVTIPNLPSALEDLALETEYGDYGHTRFAYGTPKLIHYLCQQYKRNLTRYRPNDDWAHLELNGINMGSTKLVFVPVQRFQEPSCFPVSWRSRLIVLDQESITPCYIFPEEVGDTLPRTNNGTRENFLDTWISTTISIRFNNPLASFYIDVTNLH